MTRYREATPVLTSSKDVTLDDLDRRICQANEGNRIKNRIPRGKSSKSHFTVNLPWARDKWGERAAEDWVAAVAWWQAQDAVHPLTCRKGSEHGLLVAEREGNDVSLRCPTCGLTQRKIPDCVLKLWRKREEYEGVAKRLAQDLIEVMTMVKLEEQDETTKGDEKTDE